MRLLSSQLKQTGHQNCSKGDYMKIAKTMKSILAGSIVAPTLVLAASGETAALPQRQEQTAKKTLVQIQGDKFKTPDINQLLNAKTLKQNLLNWEYRLSRGGNSGGGGNAECGKLIEDTFLEVDEVPGFNLFNQVHETVSELAPRFGIRLNKASHGLQWTFVCGDLPYRGDKIGYLVGTEQAAVQEGKTVYVDSRIFNHPSFGERSKAMLIMHESLLYILNDRNRRMNLGLTSEQIHDYVRTVNFALFQIDKKKRAPYGSWSDSELTMVLAGNQFGGWINGSTQKAIEDSIPNTFQRLSSFIATKCNLNGTVSLMGADVESIRDIIYQTCPNCRKLEFDALQSALKLNLEFGPQPRGLTLNLFQGPSLQNPAMLTRIFIGPEACSVANGQKSISSSELGVVSCRGWDPLRNLCDVENLPYEYSYPLGFSDGLWVK